MAKTRTEKIEEMRNEIAQKEARIKKLLQEQRAQERKDRNSRLCRRMALLESLLPETITLTDEQYRMFLDKAVVNEYGRNTLARIAAQDGNTATPKPATATQGNATATAQTEGNGTGTAAS